MNTDMHESTLPPPPQKSMTPVLVGAAFVIAAIGGGLFFTMGGSEMSASAQGAGSPGGPGGDYGATVGASNARAEGEQGASSEEGNSPSKSAKGKDSAGNELDGIEVPDLALMHAAPPPPDEADLPPEPKREAKKSGLPGVAAIGPKGPKSNVPAGCAGPCGAPSGAQTSALRRRAGAARGCYQSGLRQNSMLSGKMTVGVRVAPNGKACWAKPVSNTLGDPSVTSCILQKFRAAGYPKTSSCIEANVPLNFVSK